MYKSLIIMKIFCTKYIRMLFDSMDCSFFSISLKLTIFTFHFDHIANILMNLNFILRIIIPTNTLSRQAIQQNFHSRISHIISILVTIRTVLLHPQNTTLTKSIPTATQNHRLFINLKANRTTQVLFRKQVCPRVSSNFSIIHL